MKNIFAILFLASFVFMTSCKSTKDAYLDYSDKAVLEDALLWKIESSELDSPSYLYGTIHMIASEDYFLPEGTLTAIDESEKMIFEIDMNEISDMGTMMGLMSKAFMKDDTTLKDLLSDDDYQVVSDHFQKIGLPLIMLERIKPMFLSALAYGDMDPNSMKNGKIKSYEMEFFEMSKQMKKEVGGLETIEFQMGIFDKIPYKDQAEMLVETIKASDLGSDQLEEMVKMYRNQEITKMVSMINDEDENLSEHEDLLLTGRNQNWIAGMEKNMKRQSTFFAVGAAHLAGSTGVIKLLRKYGYRVSPISNKK